MEIREPEIQDTCVCYLCSCQGLPQASIHEDDWKSERERPIPPSPRVTQGFTAEPSFMKEPQERPAKEPTASHHAANIIDACSLKTLHLEWILHTSR